MISLLAPVRRPAGIRRLYESAVATADTDNWELCLYIDDEDAGPQWSWITAQPRVRVMQGPRQVLSHYWNLLAEFAEGDILGMAADDLEMQSQGWDTLIEAEFAKYPDGILFAFGWDGFRNNSHGSHGFVHRNWVNALGHFTTSDFSHDYADTWMNDLARGVGRWQYLEGLRTRHWHPDDARLGIAIDETYRWGRERGAKENPTAKYDSPEMRAAREEDIAKLRAVMQ